MQLPKCQMCTVIFCVCDTVPICVLQFTTSLKTVMVKQVFTKNITKIIIGTLVLLVTFCSP